MKLHSALAIVLVTAALVAKGGPSWLVQFRIAMLLAIALVLTACATPQPRQIVKAQQVEVTKYIRTPLPAELIQENAYAEPDPACMRDTTRVFCNGQLTQIRIDLREKLNQCNADKAELRKLDATVTNTSPARSPTPAAGVPAAGQGTDGRP